MSRGVARLCGIARAFDSTTDPVTGTRETAPSAAEPVPNGARKRESHHVSPARPLGAIALAVLFAIAGVLSPAMASPAAAALNTKVVIIVGPVGDSTTASYINEANAAAAVARKYTANVTTIYSPHATWAAVSKALAGANIVLYLGHGNGFPSPYSTTLNKVGMDGFGLNATDNAGNYNWTYYGENYVSSLRFAPNAVVLFSRLCYASGNSEWGKGNPTLSVAEQRVDNYAAAFITAGARAVIADGLGDIGWYISQLFTRHSTIDNLYRNAPNHFNNYVTWKSSRSSGYTSIEDVGTYSYVPDGDRYYRSMVSIPTLSTDSVVSGATSGSATGLNATAIVRGVGFMASPSMSATLLALLPAGTVVRVRGSIIQDAKGMTWAQAATSSGRLGYIQTRFFTFSGTAVARTALNVRSSASTTSTVVTVAGSGTAMTVTSTYADSTYRTWLKVRLANGTAGWTASWYERAP